MMFELLSEPLSYPFVLRGIAAVVVVGIVAGAVGTFVVLRGMAFLGDALAHAILPGIAVGYLVQGGVSAGLFWWALGTAIAASLAMGAVAKRAALRSDTAIGIVFAAMFALGIGLVSARDGYAVDLAHLLFGNLLGVSGSDLVRMTLLGGAALVALGVLFKEFVLIGFDPVLAASLHLPVRRLEALFLVLVSITVVVSLQAVGVALTMAMLVTPPATALLLTRHLGRAVVLACAFGAGAGVVGVLVSYHAGIAPGAAVVLAATISFGVVAAARTRRLSPATALLLLATLVGCSPGGGSREPGGAPSTMATAPSALRVIATTSVVGDLVGQIAGSDVEVTRLVPAGTDPHAFEPTAGDAAAVADADIVFAVGLSLEEYLPALVSAAGERTEVVSLADGTDAEASAPNQSGDLTGASDAGVVDPHVWLNPIAVVPWLTRASAALSARDPVGAAGYNGRAADLTQRILELDAEIASTLNVIPGERRLLVTDHVAWSHFAERYGFEIVGTVASGPTTTVEPTAKNLAHLTDTMRARGIDTIFVTFGEENRSAAILAADVGAEIVPLYVESLGLPGSGAETYEAMMRVNAQRIADALAP